MSTPPKARHKHIYELHLVERSSSHGDFDLIKICTICGKVKDADFRQHLMKRPDGTYKWIVKLKDFKQIYGDLPVIYKSDGCK